MTWSKLVLRQLVTLMSVDDDSVCDDEDGDDIHESDDNGDEDVDDNNPWGKVVRSRLLEVEKPRSGERATSCLPRVS